MEQRAQINFDDPNALDTDLLVSHIEALKREQDVAVPTYDFAIHTRTEKVTVLTPKPIILVEGILIFSDPRLRALFDIKVFVDADSDIRLMRRMKRDINERGRTHDDVMEQYLATVRPMHEMYVEPSKRFADVIVPSTSEASACNSKALAMITDYIRARTGISN